MRHAHWMMLLFLGLGAQVAQAVDAPPPGMPPAPMAGPAGMPGAPVPPPGMPGGPGPAGAPMPGMPGADSKQSIVLPPLPLDGAMRADLRANQQQSREMQRLRSQIEAAKLRAELRKLEAESGAGDLSDTGVDAIWGVDGQLQASVRVAGKRYTVQPGSKLPAGTVESIGATGVRIRGKQGAQTLGIGATPNPGPALNAPRQP